MSHYVLTALLAGILVCPSLLKDTSRLTTESMLATLERDDAPPPGDVVEVSILRLKNVRYRKGKPLPRWVRDLDGKRIRLWGYMAIGTLEGLTRFELVPESCECGRSKVNHFVDVTITDGMTRFIPGRITLEGVFEASEIEEDGFVTSLYRLKIKELPE